MKTNASNKKIAIIGILSVILFFAAYYAESYESTRGFVSGALFGLGFAALTTINFYLDSKSHSAFYWINAMIILACVASYLLLPYSYKDFPVEVSAVAVCAFFMQHINRFYSQWKGHSLWE